MPRRFKYSNPELLRQQLLSILAGLDAVFRKKTIRPKVKAMVPVNYLIRDLGGSLLGRPDATSALKRILIYFQMHYGKVIAGDELMVVSGISDYARRIRELKVEHGWPILSGIAARDIEKDEEEEQKFPAMKPDDYILLKNEQDLEAADRWKFAKQIRNKKIGANKKLLKFFRANVGKVVTGDELRYVANISSWPRRTRALRTEQGWPIATSVSGRPDLPIGAYVLEEDKQLPPHDRIIEESIRRKVLLRDEHKCRDCGWHHDLWNPSDPRHLEVHHLIRHAKGGPNVDKNLITLCNICHDDRHRSEKSENK